MKNKMIKFATLMAIPAGWLAVTSCSSTSEPKTEAKYSEIDSPTLSATGRGGVVLQADRSTFTVEGVDASDRTVKLRDSDGNLAVVECGPEVRNFDQIKEGDKVTATVAESLAIRLIKGDDVPTGAATTTAMVRSPMGAKPGGKMVDTVGFTAKILSVDAARREVTLQKMDGGKQTVKVDSDVDLANINPGDHVGVRATRAFAISVTAPEK